MTTPRWLIGPRPHLYVLFMIQFMVLILGLGGLVPELHQRGVSSALLAAGTAAGLPVFHYLLGLAGRLVPVRCQGCRSASRFLGFGWWPFTYRYACARCGRVARYDMVGR